jgi:hypothetical protein
MIDVPLLDELREIRRRLSESCQNDPVKYAEMLKQVSKDWPGKYLDKPLFPDVDLEPPNDVDPEPPKPSGDTEPS